MTKGISPSGGNCQENLINLNADAFGNPCGNAQKIRRRYNLANSYIGKVERGFKYYSDTLMEKGIKLFDKI